MSNHASSPALWLPFTEGPPRRSPGRGGEVSITVELSLSPPTWLARPSVAAVSTLSITHRHDSTGPWLILHATCLSPSALGIPYWRWDIRLCVSILHPHVPAGSPSGAWDTAGRHASMWVWHWPVPLAWMLSCCCCNGVWLSQWPLEGPDGATKKCRRARVKI